MLTYIHIFTQKISCDKCFTLENDKCICKLLLSANQNLCVTDCSEINEIAQNDVQCVKIIVKEMACQYNDGGTCKTCVQAFGTGSVYSSSVCECSAPGYVGAPNTICENCWGTGKIIDGPQCATCESKYIGSIFQQSQCVCDTSKGYVGSSDSVCSCASESCCQLTNTHYLNSACTTCDIAYSLSTWSIQLQKCMCVEANGLIGGQNSVCTSCWSQQTVVKNSVCTTCASIDINAVFIQNQCQCKDSFTLKNNICVKVTNVKQTIGLAVRVPVAAVVVITVIISVIIIKKRQNLKLKSNNSTEIPQQMIQPALQSTIAESK
ncbi:Hypothetical_protein [Hexamita inflata]|uniref:Hypothetical_protein n=1 Tax=Hexamita inflata TaxID=28002 RepID=A0AA86P537_9EUKA|nr:Hypothetical protein HINF_LOCUS18234 [Hexamita inflata]